MPFATLIPNSTIDLSLATPVLALDDLMLLNQLYTSTEISDTYADDAALSALSLNDDATLVDANGDTVVNGTYAGSGAISTANATIGLPLVANLTVSVNPIEGDYFVNDTGDVYFVSDNPLSSDHISVNISGTILGSSVNLLSIPISDLASVLSEPVLSAVQGVLDTVVVTSTYDPTDQYASLSTASQQVCFTRGVCINTKRGDIAVENLQVGDLVKTISGAYKPLLWIGSAVTQCVQTHLRPVLIDSNALGYEHGTLSVSQQHKLLISNPFAEVLFGTDETLVAAKHMLNDTTIRIDQDAESVEYFHLLFDDHEIVEANNTWAESLYLGDISLDSELTQEIEPLFPELVERALNNETPAARLVLDKHETAVLASMISS